MNSKKIIWGSFLIVIGIGYLLSNLNLIHFHFQWETFHKFWPLIFMAIGIHIIVKYSTNGKISFLLPIFYLLLFCFFFGLLGNSNGSTWGKEEDEDLTLKMENSKSLSQEYDPNSKIINLTLDAGVCEIELKDSTEKLLDMEFNGKNTEWNLERTKENEVENISINMGKGKKIIGINVGDPLQLKLNRHPIYNLNLNFGAGECDFDFSNFKVEKLNVKTGASEIDLKIGDKMDTVWVDIHSGVSDIGINIPKDFPCEIECSSALSTKVFEGFTELGNGIYRSGNDLKSNKLIKIKYSGGISNFEVNRY